MSTVISMGVGGYNLPSSLNKEMPEKKTSSTFPFVESTDRTPNVGTSGSDFCGVAPEMTREEQIEAYSLSRAQDYIGRKKGKSFLDRTTDNSKPRNGITAARPSHRKDPFSRYRPEFNAD